MALNNQEKSALSALVAREGLDALVDLVRQQAVADKKAAALAALGTSVTVTVSDWKAPAALVATATNATLPSVIQDITDALTAKDQAKLGPLFVALYASAKAHLGL